MLRRNFAAAALGLAVLTAPPALAEETKMPRTISLSGNGEVQMAPDLAVINAGVLSQAATAAEALAANTTAMNTILAALQAAGIAGRDVQTSNFTVQPRYDYNQNDQPPKLAGYDVSNTVTVSVRDLKALGGLLDKLVQAGSNQINGISFQVSKPEAALDEARKRATQDATRKARVYAEAMAVGLGPVLSISEGITYPPPVPVMRTKMARAEGLPADVPIAGGEQTLSVDVSITWEIK